MDSSSSSPSPDKSEKSVSPMKDDKYINAEKYLLLKFDVSSSNKIILYSKDTYFLLFSATVDPRNLKYGQNPEKYNYSVREMSFAVNVLSDSETHFFFETSEWLRPRLGLTAKSPQRGFSHQLGLIKNLCR